MPPPIAGGRSRGRVQDSLNVLSAVTAVLIAAIAVITTISPPESPALRRAWAIAVCILAVITVLGMAGAQYLASQEKRAAQELLAERRRTIGTLIAEGQALMQECANQNVPTTAAQDWANRVEQFLTTLGPWYVNRFRSDAGIMPGINLAGPAERNGLWRGISVRVIRLNEFAAELRE
jgi:hypothetical protein